ncbi:20782_t:CDS:1, partial [Racocetra persica]
ALAELWEVDDGKLPNYLAIEEKLVTVDKTLQLLLEDYGSSFGGTYIDVKERSVYVNTVNSSAVPSIINSPELIRTGYLKFIDFKPAKNSMDNLIHRFRKISDLARKYQPYNLIIYIDMKINDVIICYVNEDPIVNLAFYLVVKKYKPKYIELKPD